jgi:predicted flap endonuclease-1-like 5' DNA nuclease
MSLLACCLWWFALGVLAGWLLSWLLSRLFGRTEIQELAAPSPAPAARVAPVAVAPVAAAPVAAPAPPPRVDDLVVIEGIGPKIAELLRRNGIDSFDRLARTDVASLWAILDKGGTRFRLANPGTWPEQALYCVRDDWAGLKRYQDEIYGGVQLWADVPAEVVIDVAAARAAGFELDGPDDLEIVEGIGPKIAQLLRQHGVTTFVQLASARPAEITAILEKGGPNFRIANPGTWPEQAGYCVRNDWAGLKRLQDRLTAGRE